MNTEFLNNPTVKEFISKVLTPDKLVALALISAIKEYDGPNQVADVTIKMTVPIELKHSLETIVKNARISTAAFGGVFLHGIYRIYSELSMEEKELAYKVIKYLVEDSNGDN